MDAVRVTLVAMDAESSNPPDSVPGSPGTESEIVPGGPQKAPLGPSIGRRRLGVTLVVLGICGILWGVFHILGAVGSPSDGSFANRLPYNEVKRSVHGSFPGGLLRGFGGLAVAMIGNALVKGPR